MHYYIVSPKLWLKLLKDGSYLRVTTATLTRKQLGTALSCKNNSKVPLPYLQI